MSNDQDRGVGDGSCIARLIDASIEYKHGFKRRTILDGVNFSLPEKSLIGLIGPSGCGKTTLLRSLIGLIKVKSGSVQLAGYRNDDVKSKLSPSFISYMPQDIGLNDLWSAREMFKFAARVYGIGLHDLEHRINDLQQKIDLPIDLGLMSSMSGGEKRRVSLALALIHGPKLLLLDEPTVGSDPLSRLKIWNYLVECRDKLGTTIVITTHYMDEVCQANTIAFMYEGQVLRHEPPKLLMEEYGTNRLEETTQMICRSFLDQKKTFQPQGSMGTDPLCNFPVNRWENSRRLPCSSLILASFLRIISEWRLYIPVTIFFSYWVVFTTPIILCFLWKPPLDIPIHLIADQNDQFSISQLNLINDLNNTVELELKISTLEDASYQVQKGKSIGIIIFNPDYDANLLRRALDLEKDEGIPSLVQFYGDFSDKIKAHYTIRLLEDKVRQQIFDIQRRNNQFDRFLDVLEVESIDGHSLQDNERRTINYLVPILITYYLFQLGQAGAGFGLMMDKLNGFYERQLTMGIRPWQWLASHTIRHIFLSIPIHCSSCMALLIFLNVSINLNICKFIFLLVFVDIAGGSIGLLLASIFSSPFPMMCAVFMYNISIIWFNSVIWPIESLPYFSQILLITYPYGGIFRIGQRLLAGFDSNILNGYFLLVLAWIIVAFFVAVKILK
ncbi:ABC transporter G family member 23-like [Brevipalpus obovatus]|uniref:ABC transporter G family member 23-like n=1 Tax=Brevipalpus obovatus TaxID=246614 RepID=UPI003D9ED570